MKYRFNEEEHIHLLDEQPLCGTSTVMQVVAKPLTWWASGLAVAKFGWLDPKKNSPASVKTALKEGFDRVRALSLNDYNKLLDEAYRAHSVLLKSTAKTGTDMHEELEKYVKLCLEKDGIPVAVNDSEHKAVVLFSKWAIENISKFLWSEAYCYSKEHWIGGITDCGVELKNGETGIIDFKSSKEAYPNQFWQCAGYDLQLSENGGLDKDGNLLFKLEKPIAFYAILPFGASEPEPVFEYDVAGSKEAFKSCLNIYKKLEQYKV